jgi:hypothetical protein
MVLNTQKTKAMHFTSNNTQLHLPPLHLQDQMIQFSKTEKLLGVFVDSKLKWKIQIEMILKKCNSQLYLLLRIKQYLDLHARKLFINSYILPHLDYCCTIWGNCSNDLINEIIKFQKRAAGIYIQIKVTMHPPVICLKN